MTDNPQRKSVTVQAVVPEGDYLWLYGQANVRQQSLSGYVRDIIRTHIREYRKGATRVH